VKKEELIAEHTLISFELCFTLISVLKYDVFLTLMY